jgi:hypothetical protein
VLRVEDLVVEVLRPLQHSKQFQLHLYTFMLVVRVHQVMAQQVVITVVEPPAQVTTMKVLVEEPRISEPAHY